MIRIDNDIVIIENVKIANALRKTINRSVTETNTF